jgi:molecular chaperone GrpE
MNSPETTGAKGGPAAEPQQAAVAAAVPLHAEAPTAEQLAAAKKEAADNRDRYLRAAADLENFRRRTVREKEELRLFATSRLLEDLLPALDNLALGLASARETKADLKGLVGGVDLLQQQLKAALAAHGLSEINPLGQPFDPHQHEAISHQPSADVAAEHVVKVVRMGYVLNGRLLRPASVIVSSGKPTEGKAG